MANTSAVYARIDKNLKENAESILSQLGVSPSAIIQMLYSQIILTRGIPFDVQLPPVPFIAAGALTREQFDTELAKGVESAKDGVLSADAVDAVLEKEFRA
ncbi:MAG: type II toxin-antitoxin system RelB/DinJ family antitoxin [Clostridia bacterium]|nr:type II toxin-antitoxin system RelB/DinJ family antitoxin [Clostridia bacterium]